LWAWTVAAGCVAVIAVLCALPQSWGDKLTQDTLMDIHASRFALPVVRCLPEFALGLLAYRLSTTRAGASLVRRRWIAIVISLAVILLLPIPRTDFVVVLLFPALVMCLTSDQSLPGRILSSPPAELLGRLSYSIYLIHNLMGGLLNRIHLLAEEHGLRHEQSYAVVVGILLTFLCSYVAYIGIEVPCRRWLRDLFEKRQPSSAAVEPIAP
jgi:peptidoglycan/LPS O-acetylase OafA/YrhL